MASRPALAMAFGIARAGAVINNSGAYKNKVSIDKKEKKVFKWLGEPKTPNP